MGGVENPRHGGDPNRDQGRDQKGNPLLPQQPAAGSGVTGQSCQKPLGVENQCHWVLDVIYREDESRARTGHNAENLCTTRALAMNLTRLETSNKRGIEGRVKRAGWDNTYLEKTLKI